jgi:geranylgeranyl diphosphate synthase type II
MPGVKQNPHERRYDRLRQRVDRHLASLVTPGTPRSLRDACTYVLSGGGKRLRAILVLLASEAVGGSASRTLHAAAAVEVMHNFTLVHDDIMDHAPTRRGKPTVHVRWDLNTALVTGDTLLAIAYENLMLTQHKEPAMLAQLFTASVIGVCEGQSLDLEYEQRNNVSVRDYFTMIEQKTGRLVTVAAELGGRIGGGTPAQVKALRLFGHHLGRAFQLQDDLLDVIGDEREFGKAIGGDIIEGKRTYLLLRARERARGEDRTLLDRVMRRKTLPPSRPETMAQRRAMVTRVRAIYQRYGVIEETRRKVMENTDRALKALRVLPASTARTTLQWLAGALVHRSS